MKNEPLLTKQRIKLFYLFYLSMIFFATATAATTSVTATVYLDKNTLTLQILNLYFIWVDLCHTGGSLVVSWYEA